MKCYCVETEDKFTFIVENAEDDFIENIEHAWFKLDNGKYIKEYSNNIYDKDILKKNFQRLGKEMFQSKGDWKKSLKIMAEKCLEHNIEWYITGSISEAVFNYIGFRLLFSLITIFSKSRSRASSVLKERKRFV